MPPAPAHKGKGKGRDVRQPRSRNTTPNSSFSSSNPAVVLFPPRYLENDVSKLLVPSSTQYAEVLDRTSGIGPIPDSKSLGALMDQLKSLGQMAEERKDVCNAGLKELSQRRKEVVEDLDVGDRTKVKRETEEDEEAGQGHKGGKLKKRRERGSFKEEMERPLTHGSHEVARQDGAETKVEGAASPASKKLKMQASEDPESPSPFLPSAAPGAGDAPAAATSPISNNDPNAHQPKPAPAVPHQQVFGSDPLRFDDPTIYHIRKVTPDMTDEEKKEVYCVSRFPTDGLSHLVAGTPPDKDFSNAKPTNQVSANTFLSYVEPFVRPLMEEDIAFLKERGDRTTPFIMPRRGKKHYIDIWAEEEGLISTDRQSSDQDGLSLNQGRGNIDQLTDELAETDRISVGPLVSRLYSLLRYEHRASPEEATTNGTTNADTTIANGISNGGDSMDIDHPNPPVETETNNNNNSNNSRQQQLPSATTFPDASPTNFKIPAAKLDHAQLDERLKAELRHVGFLGPDDNPDYDAHYDDDIAQRLRLLQSELKKQMIINSARKTRMLEIARERLAYQEYTTIHDDLDSQVQQAYLKRTRTLGKSKKGSQAKHRPGGAGGGSHLVSGSAGVSRPAIGDVARTLLDRRKRWRDCIGPVFRDSKTTVPGREESIFDPSLMAEYEKAELEGWDEEQE